MKNLAIVLLPMVIGVSGCGQNLFAKAYTLQSGTYKVNTLSNKMDVCQIDSDPQEPIQGATYTLTNSGSETGIVEFDLFGKGTVDNNVGTLTSNQKITSGNCSFDLAVTTILTVTANNAFTADVEAKETNRKGCDFPSGLGSSCTSTWTMDVSKQ